MRRRLLFPLVTVMLLVLSGAEAGAAVPSWTTYRHDAARSGIDPDSTMPVTPTQAWRTAALDGEVYGQPLLYGSSVYVATENDTVYELSAANGAVMWSTHLATPERSSMAPCGDISPSIGITGTPVIDPSANRIYAVAAVSDGAHASSVRHELFALDLISGSPITGFPIAVDPSFPSGGAAVNQLQRPGLALVSGRILIGFGGNDGDCATYWGWLVSAPTDGTTALSSFQVDPDHTEGAIWGAGNAPTVDPAGNVFVATGNGSGNATADPQYGDSVVKLNALASPLDWWAPPNWQAVDGSDADLGSGMPTLLPGGFLFQSGKDGNAYVLNGAALGHVSSPVSELSGFCSPGSFGGSVYDPGNSTIYAACGGGVRALALSSGAPPSLTLKPGFSAPSGGAGPPMIAAGLVWVTEYSNGTLYGLDPGSGAASSHFAIPEAGSDVNHFASPSAGGGRLFVASGNQVTAYTIAQSPTVTSTTTALAPSVNPVPAGTPVTLTATVAPTPDGGTVTFTDSGAPVAACSGLGVSAVTAGQADCSTAFALPGKHNLKASYSGSVFYAASASGVVTEAVTKAIPGGAGAPVVSHVSISPHRLRARRTATIRLTVSESAIVTVAITRLRHGHLIHHRCSRTTHRGKSCLVRVTLRRLRFRAHAGRNTFKLRLRRLAPGDYAALISAADPAGRRSPAIRLGFTTDIRTGRALWLGSVTGFLPSTVVVSGG